jgi:glycine/D-amino acid oxidase-like deaminating enzyme
MACCALAAFIVSQLLVVLDWLRERVLGLTPALAQANPNAAWRHGDAAMLPPARAVFAAPRRLALALAGGALAFALALVASQTSDAQRSHLLQIPYLCTSIPAAGLD